MNKDLITFKFRAFVSILAGLLFLVMVFSGIILFIVPSGRISRITQWQFWGYDRFRWISLHVWFSLLFVFISVVHIVLNRRAILHYLRDKLSGRYFLRIEWIFALAVCLLVFTGSGKDIPPFSTLAKYRSQFKQSQSVDNPQPQYNQWNQSSSMIKELDQID